MFSFDSTNNAVKDLVQGVRLHPLRIGLAVCFLLSGLEVGIISVIWNFALSLSSFPVSSLDFPPF